VQVKWLLDNGYMLQAMGDRRGQLELRSPSTSVRPGRGVAG
jgi:hypothetical protein